MARIDINGIGIDYELVGDAGAPAVALTPGGRFPRNTAGLAELAAELAKAGRRVLLWDRPNCGASDITFDGPGESIVQGRTLAGLIRALDLGPTVIAGGSAGSRVSLLASVHDPEIVSHLVIWWISGDPISLAQLAAYYYGDSAIAAARGGMEAVADMPFWADQIRRNPGNRDIILAQDPVAFIATMQRWAKGFAYSDTSPVPGLKAEDFARLTMPVLIFRSGESDISHTRRTSEWVHEMIPHSKLIEPPWGDQEWNERSVAAHSGQAPGLFVRWPLLAPYILDFSK